MAGTKVAVVTGGNKGIGFAIVKGLCEQFEGVVYLTARDVIRGETAVEELKKLGLHPKFHQLDVNDDTSVKKFHDYVKQKYGGINVLVNNAAIAFKVDAPESFSEQAETTIAVNYFSLLRVCNYLFDLLKPHARVVNLSSVCGHLKMIPGADLRTKLNDPNLTIEKLSALMNAFVESAKKNQHEKDGWGNSAYVASKVGVTALTIIQQREISKDATRPGIAINCVHPGYVDTDMTSHKGSLTTEQGADAPLYLALLPQEQNNIKGCYVWKDRQIVDWAAPDTPSPY